MQRVRFLPIVPLAALLAFAHVAGAQSRKEARKYGIRAVTESVADSAGRTPHKAGYRRFDKAGRTIEWIEYRPDGTIERRTAYTYDAAGELKEETLYRGDGSVRHRITCDYNARGEKTAERRFDAAGNLLRRTEYRYDKNGLKAERKTFDGAGRLLTTKTYSYHY